MQFRLISLFGLSVALLAACGGATTVQYRLTFDSTDPGTVDELSKAAVRVAERRLDHLGAALTEQTVTKDAEGVTMELHISDGSIAETLTAELTAPFDLDIMETTTDEAAADIVIEGFGAFVRTGVTGDDLVSVIASVNETTSEGLIRINFSVDGQAKMRALFERNVGKNLGLFVRGRLVSALMVNDASFPVPLIIEGIPDPELAQIFADDVNVGTHVTVTPL